MSNEFFLRIVLPIILIAVFLVVGIFVLNSVESIQMMETSKQAGPTILNP